MDRKVQIVHEKARRLRFSPTGGPRWIRPTKQAEGQQQKECRQIGEAGKVFDEIQFLDEIRQPEDAGRPRQRDIDHDNERGPAIFYAPGAEADPGGRSLHPSRARVAAFPLTAFVQNRGQPAGQKSGSDSANFRDRPAGQLRATWRRLFFAPFSVPPLDCGEPCFELFLFWPTAGRVPNTALPFRQAVSVWPSQDNGKGGIAPPEGGDDR